jgi:hypothetical protein
MFAMTSCFAAARTEVFLFCYTSGMATKKQQTTIISLSLIAAPIVCLLLGVLGRTMSSHELNDDGADWSLVLSYVGLVVGLAGSLIGLVIVALTTFLTRKSGQSKHAIYGYLLPPSLAILFMCYVLTLNI